MFEGTAPAGHIRVADLVRELKTYCSEKLTEQQISELMAQVGADSVLVCSTGGCRGLSEGFGAIDRAALLLLCGCVRRACCSSRWTRMVL